MSRRPVLALLAVLGSASGCTQPVLLDAGRDARTDLDAPALDAPALDVGADAPGADAPSFDAPSPLDAPAPIDAGADAPASCADVFGGAPGFELCAERPASCELRAELGGGDCAALCASFGGACIGARNDGSTAPYCTTFGGTWLCNQDGMSAICECTRPGVGSACDPLFSAFAGHTVCSETSSTCEVQVTLDAMYNDCRDVCEAVGGTCDTARRTSATVCAAAGSQPCGAGLAGTSAICVCRL